MNKILFTTIFLSFPASVLAQSDDYQWILQQQSQQQQQFQQQQMMMEEQRQTEIMEQQLQIQRQQALQQQIQRNQYNGGLYGNAAQNKNPGLYR